MIWIFLFYILPILFLWVCLVKYLKNQMAKKYENRNRDMSKVPLKELLLEGEIAFAIPLIPLANIVMVAGVLGVGACMWIGKTKAWNKLINMKL